MVSGERGESKSGSGREVLSCRQRREAQGERGGSCGERKVRIGDERKYGGGNRVKERSLEKGVCWERDWGIRRSKQKVRGRLYSN